MEIFRLYNILYYKFSDHIPQGKDWDFSPRETGIYQAAYVTGEFSHSIKIILRSTIKIIQKVKSLNIEQFSDWG